MGQQARNRQKAKELGALEAEKLIAAVPYLARLLSQQQVEHFQKVLDAAVLNPIYVAEHKKALENSVKVRSGPMVMYNESKKRKAYKILSKRVKVSESDQYIRLDHHKMLTPHAFMPRTNNPDEANYLAKIRHILISRGVWLRLKQPWGHGRDPKVWAFSFTLGKNGDTIKTDDALIDQDELLRTLGGHYDAVTKGPILTELRRQASRLKLAHENGESLHRLHASFRRDAAPGVVGVSDFLGGADFPSTDIWSLPFKLWLMAMEAMTAGNIWKTEIFLASSAIVVEANGILLAEYAKDTIRGGERAVIVLEVVVVAGAVAEVVLSLGLGALKVAGRKAMTQAAKREGLDKLMTEGTKRYAKRAGLTEAELGSVRLVQTTQRSGTTLGSGMRARQSTGHGGSFEKW